MNYAGNDWLALGRFDEAKTTIRSLHSIGLNGLSADACAEQFLERQLNLRTLVSRRWPDLQHRGGLSPTCEFEFLAARSRSIENAPNA